MKNKSKALLSWVADAIGSVLVIALLGCWLSDLRFVSGGDDDDPSMFILSPSFLYNGFCLSPLFENTHLICAKFDAVCGIGFVLAAVFITRSRAPTNPSILLGIASYLFSHSYGHYVAGTEMVEPGSMKDDRMPVADLVILTVILSIGPSGGTNALVKAGKISKTTGTTTAGLLLVVLVAIYAIYIRRPRYALLYINITILLTSILPMAFAIGFKSETDIALRSSDFSWFKIGANLMVAGIVFCEPFFCDSIVAKLGGHLIFDISLALQATVGVLAMTSVAEKDKVKSE